MLSNVLCNFAVTAEKYKDKVVFSDSMTDITFGRLDSVSDSIATCLAPEINKSAPVCVLCSRSVYTPAAFIGIVKAGGFYAPIDCSLPLGRIQSMLGVAKPDVLLTDRQNYQLAASLEFEGRIEVLEDLIEKRSDKTLLKKIARNIVPTDPLYIIFTSGSTGVPKGVITSHLSLMNYIDAVCDVLEITDGDVMGNQSPLDYIAAVRDIYIPLKTGASTVIIPKNEFAMPKNLFETLNKYKVTTLCWSVAGIEIPAKLGAFSELKPEYVNKVLFSGSVMPCKYLKIWQQNLPDAMFVNQYGPTEATASCTYYVVNEKVNDDTVLPIGVPYNGYSILLLDENDKEVKCGDIGQICVGGVGVTLGYYKDVQRTAESFIQNPLNNDYRDIIYKTGDLGRFDEDGILHFHGRMDRQIKHMGHRIELGEIEATALSIDGVNECCSLYNKDKEHLYLFYTGNATSKEIVMHFRSVLSPFMAPRKLIALDNIPKLPNGKIDMQTLKNYFKQEK